MKKTNKTFKRFAAITSASLLAACAIMPTIISAAEVQTGETACTITINGWNTTTNNDNASHTLAAYQIFKGKLDSTGKILTDIDFGDGITGATLSKKLVEASGTEDHALFGLFPQLKDDENNNIDYTAKKIVDILNSTKKVLVTNEENGETTEVDEAIFAFDSDTTKAFAKIVAECLTNKTSGTYNVASGENKATISNLPVGYYLIQDASISSETGADNTGAKTRYILQLTEKDASINIKASAPTVMKKVQEDSLTAEKTGTVDFAGDDEYNPGTGYNDVADYSIGDEVPFKLYGTMPSTLDDYDHYYYKFTDTLDGQFNAPEDVKITIGTTKLEISRNGTDGGEGVVYTYSGDGNCSVTFEDGTFVVEFKDIKKYTGVDKNTVVTVDYNAVLNETAKIGYEGQLNKVDLTYSNNPNEEYKPWDENGDFSGDEVTDKGTTKEDGVIVFTYGFDINKYENGVVTDKLADAQFAIYYYDAGGAVKYLVVENGLFKGATVDNPTAESNSIWTSTDTDNIVIKGLDAGTYYIKEIAPPDGYNKLTEDVEVVVSSTYTDNTIQDGDKSVPIYRQSWTYSASGNNDKLAMDKISVGYSNNTKYQNGDTLATVDIENKAGSTLPGTGGIGTTIFYLGGGAMAAIGGIYLISKRRMRKSEE